ncbi:hypothetical protein K439DRAFT_1614657 [Ramaria rubella]|nr:hypothetical protein K439DRAFT_1614657 [Ramaria rubella]
MAVGVPSGKLTCLTFVAIDKSKILSDNLVHYLWQCQSQQLRAVTQGDAWTNWYRYDTTPYSSAMSPTIRQLIDPTKPEIDATVKALSEAFNYAVYKAELGGDGSLVPVMLKAYVAAAPVGGEVYVAEVEGKGVVGATVWFAPGQKFLGTEAQHNAGWDQLMQQLDKKYTSWWDYVRADPTCFGRLLTFAQYFPTYDAFCEKHFGAGFKLNAYHLQASALVRDVEDKIRSKHIPMCVETWRMQAPIYESMGFVIQGSETLHGATEDFVYCLLSKH